MVCIITANMLYHHATNVPAFKHRSCIPSVKVDQVQNFFLAVVQHAQQRLPSK